MVNKMLKLANKQTYSQILITIWKLLYVSYYKLYCFSEVRKVYALFPDAYNDVAFVLSTSKSFFRPSSNFVIIFVDMTSRPSSITSQTSSGTLRVKILEYSKFAK